MASHDFQLAKTALKVLPNYEANDFEQWFKANYNTREKLSVTNSSFTIVEYNCAQERAVILPAAYDHISDAVNRHLASATPNDPWGILDKDLIALKLSDQPGSQCGRLLLFRVCFVSILLKKLFPDEFITPAEQRTLLQTLSGQTVKQAAEQDSLSQETKKTQLKSLFQKTGIRSQQVLSSFLISHLLMEVAASHCKRQSNAESDQMFFDYVDQYMGTYVRASVIQESVDRRFRIIEIGDPAGIPVICVHHLGIINFSEREIAEIHGQGIRLICPLRHGAIGPLDKNLSPLQYTEHAIAGIDLAASLIAEKKVTVIALLSGALYASHYLKYNPTGVKNLIFFGASYKPQTKSTSKSKFKNNLHELATNNEDMLSATVSYLLDKVDYPDQLKKVMEESHINCAADIAEIDDLFSDPKQVKSMQHRLKNSSSSIVQDLRTQSISDWQPLFDNATDTQVHFVHGSADKLIPVEHIEALTKEHNYHLHTIENAGNWIFGKHTPQTFSIVRNILTGK